jgi:hypothetical protein
MTIHALGPFRLDTQGDLLFRGSEPAALGRRAIALLRTLVERPGALVSKDALIEAAWPGQAVEECNSNADGKPPLRYRDQFARVTRHPPRFYRRFARRLSLAVLLTGVTLRLHRHLGEQRRPEACPSRRPVACLVRGYTRPHDCQGVLPT